MMTCHYPDLGSASDWSCPDGNSGGILRSEESHVISLEFLRSFLKRNFSGKISAGASTCMSAVFAGYLKD